MESSPDQLPDLAHVAQIGKRLWESTPNGRATVMVGSGFSRNAEPRTASPRPFPLWLDLAEQMYTALHPAEAPGPERQRNARTAAANGGLLQLALEFDAAFGRDALDRLVLDGVPDDEYDPGELHRLLLTLPWADVLTTNYDTLLERARASVYGRRYGLVHAAHDLPSAHRPRIVKLHGSLRSHRPFVVTEEDYRQYPRRAAPFVNTVRQALMETALVLIGFSGDDPNFLSWIGWVRDELGPTPPSIYLCGVLDLTTAQQRVLAHRGVTPVDLGPLVRDRNDPNRYRRAVRWLLLTLLRARPSSGVGWPVPERDDSFPDDPTLAPFVSGPVLGEDIRPSVQPVGFTRRPVDELLRLADAWEASRHLDPGWAVLPLHNRRSLGGRTASWNAILRTSLADLDPANRLRLAYEWIWRTERVLDPETPAGLAGLALEPADPAGLTGEAVEQWVVLAFAQLRLARRRGDRDAFRDWGDRLRPVAAHRRIWHAELCHETAQECLGILDFAGARRSLDDWPDAALDPVWGIRRAALVSEMGDVSSAHAAALAVLGQVRSEAEASRTRFVARSREGMAMLLADLTAQRSSGEDSGARGIDTRRDELDGIRCNPWAELEALGAQLAAEPPGIRPTRIVTVNASGNEVVSLFDAPALERGALRPAYELLGLFEAGLPFWSDTAIPELARAALWVADVWPEWATATLVRMLDGGALDEVLDRARVVQLSERFTTDLAASAVAALDDPLGRAGPQSVWTSTRTARTRRMSITVVSRLAFRLPTQVRLTALAHAVGFVRASGKQMHPAWRATLYNLFSSLIEAVEGDEEWDVVTALLMSVPLSGHPLNALDPLVLVPPAALRGRRPDGAVAPILDAVAALEGGGLRRAAGLLRLETLYQAGWLTDEETGRFARSLWAETDPETGMPDLDLLSPWRLLFLPEQEPGQAAAVLRRFLVTPPRSWRVRGFLTSDVEHRFESWAESVRDASAEAEESYSGIEWSMPEVDILARQILDWWSAHCEVPPDEFSGLLGASTVRSAANAVRVVVLPGAGKSEAGQSCARVLRDMVETGYDVRFALPGMLLATPDASRDIEAEIRRAFASGDSQAVADAAEAVFRWANLAKCEHIPFPEALADELVAVVSTRSMGGTEAALHWISMWLRTVPQTFPLRLLLPLVSALEVLLSATAVPTESDRLRARSTEARRALLRRPYVRALASALARDIWENAFEQLGESGQAVVLAWRDAAAEDPYPEVRRTWAAERE